MFAKILIAAFCLAAVVTAAPAEQLADSDFESLWQTFVSDHGKTYHPEEVLMRFRVFKDNVNFIMDHNANKAEELGYTVGINQFADMTNAEFKRLYTGYNAPLLKSQENVEILPAATADSVDWTTKNAVTPVKNQAQCGSCWAFSTTGSVEGINAITTGKLQSFSEEELVQCAGSYGNQGCNGGLMDDGFKYIMAKGDVLESTYPYTSGTGTTGTCQSSKTSNPAVKVTGYKDVAAANEDQLKAAVQKQPVSVAIEADQSGFQFYKSGVFSGTCGTNLDHGVLVVGYGTDSGKDFWKVKNSWGATWGQKGYIMLARGTGGKGQCGVAAQPSYPTMGGPTPPTPPSPPTPTPPTPPSPPTPPTPPSPSGSLYEAPPCQSSEDAVQVQGLSGDFCSPKCTGVIFKHCPAVPAGVTAKAQCILQTAGSSSPTNCALICDPSADGQCPSGASCQPIQGTGICTYPKGDIAKQLFHEMVINKA